MLKLPYKVETNFLFDTGVEVSLLSANINFIKNFQKDIKC